MTTHTFSLLLAGALLAGTAGAQVPAAAPAGSTAVCKDGTFSGEEQTVACKRHGGVEQWWGVTTNMKPADVPAAGDRGPYEKTLEPVPTSPPVAAATTRVPATQGNASAGPARSGDAARVWVDPATKLFRCADIPKSDGKRPQDLSMTQAEARRKGFQSEHGKACPEKQPS